MTVIRDVVRAVELFEPASIEAAQAVLDRYGADAWVLAGGLDSFEWLKDRVKRPQALVDLAGIEELKGIRPWGDGLEIGAMATLSEVARHPIVRERFGLLVQAAEAAAAPHVRVQGTIGGNVSQDTRCGYYRAGWACYRAGGDVCYADTPEAINREHAILDADRCVAVSPSDTAPALIALDAQMVIRTGAGGEQRVAAEDYFVGPATDIARMTILQPGDLLTAVRLPGTWAGAPRHSSTERSRGGAQFYFEKARDPNGWDFALASVASALVMQETAEGSVIERVRLAVNGVAARPLRLRAVEELVRGRPRNEATAVRAANLAVAGAKPLRYNAYKVALLRDLVKRALRGGK